MVSKKSLNLVFSGILGLSLFAPGALSINSNANPRAQEKQENKVSGQNSNSNENKGERTGLTKKLFEKAAIGTGKVLSIGADSFVLQKDDKSFTIQVDSKTQYRRKFWGKSSFAELKLNDQVSVIGTWVDEEKTTVLAKVVRNMSVQKRLGTFFGVVKSLNADGFVIDSKRGELVVTINSSSKLVNRREQPIVQADIKVGDRIRVKGLWDKDNSTIDEVKQVKDFSLPPKASGSASSSPTSLPTSTPTPTPTQTPSSTSTATPTPTATP